jgi:hypothetical protein
VQKFLRIYENFPQINFFSNFFVSKIACFHQNSNSYKEEKFLLKNFCTLRNFCLNMQKLGFFGFVSNKISGRNFCLMSEISKKTNISVLYLDHMSNFKKSSITQKKSDCFEFFFHFSKKWKKTASFSKFSCFFEFSICYFLSCYEKIWLFWCMYALENFFLLIYISFNPHWSIWKIFIYVRKNYCTSTKFRNR